MTEDEFFSDKAAEQFVADSMAAQEPVQRQDLGGWSVMPHWPQGTAATPAQFIEWFDKLRAEERVAVITSIQDAAIAGATCMMMGHEGHIEQLAVANKGLFERITTLEAILMQNSVPLEQIQDELGGLYLVRDDDDT